MKHLHNQFSEHPILGFITSVISILFGWFFEVISKYQGVHLPPIILELGQLLSYLAAVCIGITTIVGFIKKNKKE